MTGYRNIRQKAFHDKELLVRCKGIKLRHGKRRMFLHGQLPDDSIVICICGDIGRYPRIYQESERTASESESVASAAVAVAETAAAEQEKDEPDTAVVVVAAAVAVAEAAAAEQEKDEPDTVVIAVSTAVIAIIVHIAFASASTVR